MALLLSSLALATFDFLSHPNRSGLYKRQLFDIGEDKEKESSLIWGQKGATTSKSSSYDSRISAPLLLHSYLKSIGHTWPHYRSSKESRPSPSNKSFRDEIKHGNRRIRLRRGAGLLFFCFRRNVIGRISRWCVRRSAVSEWPALSPATGHGGAPHHGRVSSATLPLAACSLFLCFMSFYLFVCVSVCECVCACVDVSPLYSCTVSLFLLPFFFLFRLCLLSVRFRTGSVDWRRRSLWWWWWVSITMDDRYFQMKSNGITMEPGRVDAKEKKRAKEIQKQKQNTTTANANRGDKWQRKTICLRQTPEPFSFSSLGSIASFPPDKKKQTVGNSFCWSWQNGFDGSVRFVPTFRDCVCVFLF